MSNQNLDKQNSSNEKAEFEEYLDGLTRETGYEFDKVSKGFAYQAAKNYYEQKSKEENDSLKEKVNKLSELKKLELMAYGEYLNQCINQRGVMSYPEIKTATEVWIEVQHNLTNNQQSDDL